MSRKSGNKDGKGGKGGNYRGTRKHVKVKTAKKRSNSSARWLERQLNDPYVLEAKRRGYRSRAAFKILEMDEQVGLFKKGQRIVDLGAAPGGWTQVAVDIVKPEETGGCVVALDILEMDEIPGAAFICCDFNDDDEPDKLKDALNGPADLVLSDMAAPTVGHRQTDHLRIMALAELAYDFARQVLAKDGAFVCKLFQGGAEKELLDLLNKDFIKVKHVKPPASRSDSSEVYVVATGFRGADTEDEEGNE